MYVTHYFDCRARILIMDESIWGNIWVPPFTHNYISGRLPKTRRSRKDCKQAWCLPKEGRLRSASWGSPFIGASQTIDILKLRSLYIAWKPNLLLRRHQPAIDINDAYKQSFPELGKHVGCRAIYGVKASTNDCILGFGRSRSTGLSLSKMASRNVLRDCPG